MNATPKAEIEFKLPWRGRQIGQRDSLLDPNVMQELVRTNRAVYVDAAGVAPETPSPAANVPKRTKKKREE